MIIPIAWRNVWRNKLRSLVVIIAITLGIFAGVFATAFMKGMADHRINSAIESETSHMQLHHKDYRQKDKLALYIPAADKKLEKIRSLNEVKSASNRLKVDCMISAAGTASGAKVLGIHPEEEKKVTDIHGNIVKGSYFEDIPDRVKPLVLGKKMAEKLNAQLRSRIVINLTNIHGNPTSAGFRVTGIYDTDNANYDGLHAFVRYQDLLEATGMKQGIGHEIAVYLKHNDQVQPVQRKLRKMFQQTEVATWKELSPDLSYLSSVMDQYTYIIIIIILLALCFGIINTMLMAVLERVKELGMLMAIGMNRRRVFLMIMTESVLLSLTGGVSGILIGWAITRLTGATGIDMSMYAEGLQAMGWSTIIYPDIGIDTLIRITFLVIVTGILSSIYPAIKALKLNPADSLRTE
ncbi:MAG: FtsX-like permease family protein [Bacteroidales bacterium]